MYDFHLHSSFSEDCDTSMENMIKTAIQKGIKEMCFTEHLDEDYPDPDWTFALDFEKYDQKIKELQAKFKDEIKIRKGIELGVQPHVLESYQNITNREYFDFIICSMHVTKKKDLHNGDFFKDKSLNQAYEEYYGELLACIQNFKQFNVLGHLDLVTRYKYEEGVGKFLDIIEEIFKEIIPYGKGIEINTSGFYYGIGRVHPSIDILKLYKDLGGEIITIGSDAHKPERLAEHYDHSVELLKILGYKYVTTFENKKPIFHKL